MNKLAKQYVAGFVDGEGYLGIIKRKREDGLFGYYYKTVVKVAQRTRDREVLDTLKNQYGGYVSKTREHRNTQQSNMWELCSKIQILKLLNDIEEYSVVKKKHIEIIKGFMALPDFTNASSGENFQKKLKLMEEKTKLFDKLATLNHRGLAETE